MVIKWNYEYTFYFSANLYIIKNSLSVSVSVSLSPDAQLSMTSHSLRYEPNMWTLQDKHAKYVFKADTFFPIYIYEDKLSLAQGH